MSRRTRAVRRPVPPDPRYDSQTVSKFVNALMYDGKKGLAEGVFYKAMDLIEERTGQPGVAVFKQAREQREADGRGEEPPGRWRDRSRCRSKCGRIVARRWRCAG